MVWKNRNLARLASGVGIVAVMAGVPMVANAQSSSDTDVGQQDIVVTAERFTSTVQKSAISIEAFDSKLLAQKGVRDPRDLNAVVTGIAVYPIQNQVQVAIRGVGSANIDPRSDGTVSVSLDNISFARPSSTGGAFFDLERVEVLKGPQGTLYGRNSAAGALNIITAKPKLGELGGHVSGTFGNYSLFSGEAAINIPLGENFAIRAAVNATSRKGYIEHYYNDDKSYFGRLSLLWKPTEQLTVYAMGNIGHSGGHGQPFTFYPRRGVKPWTLQGPPFVVGGPVVPGAVPKDGENDKNDANAQLRIDYDFGGVTLTSATGYVRQKTDSYFPNGAYIPSFGHGAPEFEKPFDTSVPGTIPGGFRTVMHSFNRTWTQEIRLAGNTDANHAGGLKWVVGAFYLNDGGRYQFWAPRPTSPTSNYTAVPQRSKAVFAQATYGVTDDFRITAGGRYTWDRKGFTDQNYVTKRETPYSTKFKQFTWKIGAEYDVGPANLLYADVSKGYIAGGLNNGVPQPTLPAVIANPGAYLPFEFRPQTIIAYQFGSKNRFMDGLLQVNLEGFYYKYQNYQYTTTAINNSGVFGAGVDNLPTLKSYGGELGLVLTPAQSDRFNVTFSYLHAKVGPGTYAGNPSGDRVTAVEVQGPKSDMIISPPWSIQAGFTHVFTIGDGHLDASVNAKVSDGYSMILYDSKPENRQKSYVLGDASLTYYTGGDKFSVQAWVKNIGKTPVRVNAQSASGYLYAILPPRTFGVTLKAGF